MEYIDLSPEQQAAFDLLDGSIENFFVTGKAGTGKSVLLEYFVKHTKKEVAICAPTGLAALHVGGVTLHSLFGLSRHEQDVKDKKAVYVGSEIAQVLRNINCLVIDEASMVRVDIMDMVHAKLCEARGSSLPFGGCQVILFGDLYQLSPVIGEDAIKTFISVWYRGKHFFHAPVVAENPFTIIELKKVQRQRDEKFISVLNRIRVGENSREVLDIVNTRLTQVPDGVRAVTLTARRNKAADVNARRLACLPGKEYAYKASYTGDFVEEIEKIQSNPKASTDNLPADIVLKLKIGAQIMMTRNDTTQERKWVNGTVGEIYDLTETSIFVRINGKVHSVDRYRWTNYEYEYNEEKKAVEHKETGAFEQFPIKLAYAMTIHKSQGQTYDGIQIDLTDGRIFEAGQIYVALSRCRSMDGIFLTREFLPSEIMVKPDVVKFMEAHPPVKLDLKNRTAPVQQADGSEERQEEKIDKAQNTTIPAETERKAGSPTMCEPVLDLSVDHTTASEFLTALKKEPLIYSNFFTQIRAIEHTPYVDDLIDLLEKEVNDYRNYYNRLLHGGVQYTNRREILTERNRIYKTIVSGIKKTIADIVNK